MKPIIIVGLLITFFVAGCGSSTELSLMQKRQMTTKMIEGSYDNVFRASMTILQDQGYVIKQTDLNTGLIVANRDRESSKTSQFFSALLTGGISHKNTVIEISATINKLNKTAQELRLNIQETEYSGSGGKTNINQIYDPKIYQKLFNEIILEVKRREAMNTD